MGSSLDITLLMIYARRGVRLSYPGLHGHVVKAHPAGFERDETDIAEGLMRVGTSCPLSRCPSNPG